MSLWKAAHAIRPRLCSPNTVFHYSIYTKKNTPKIITKSSKNLPKWIPEPVKKWSRKKDKKKTPKKTKMCQNGSSLGGGRGELTQNSSFLDPWAHLGSRWAPKVPKTPKITKKTPKIAKTGANSIKKRPKKREQIHRKMPLGMINFA